MSNPLTPLKILLLEDERLHVEIAQTILHSSREFQIDVVWVNNLTDLTSALKNQIFDIIIADFHVFAENKALEVHGLQIIGLARSLQIDTPIIYLTGRMDRERADECLHLGAAAIVFKENMDELLPIIEKNYIQYQQYKNGLKAKQSLKIRDRALNTLSSGIVLLEMKRKDTKVIYTNKYIHQILDIAFNPLVPLTIDSILFEADYEQQKNDFISAIRTHHSTQFEAKIMGGSKSSFWAEIKLSPLKNEDPNIDHMIIIIDDISQRKNIEAQSLQNQKLESIGQLAAGIAHEINTPTQYVGDNLHFIKESISNLIKLLHFFQNLISQKPSAYDAKELQDIENAIEDCDLDYLQQELPISVQQSLEGVSQIATIVQAMKSFSHPDSSEKNKINLKDLITNTLAICKNEWKYIATIKTPCSVADPFFLCYSQQLGQVLLNLIVNASHAIADRAKTDKTFEGLITVSLSSTEDFIELSVSDNGCGIPEDIRGKIFDPFFTTKEIGKGTGQGLSMAYNSIVSVHKGKIWVDSVVGEGASFYIQLPKQKSTIS